MTRAVRLSWLLGLVVLATSPGASALAQPTAISYQGQLNAAGAPANGLFDFVYSLYSVSSGGTAVATPITNAATGVTNGLFQANLDFGAGPFTGGNLWLEVDVQTNNGAGFTALLPRQPVTSAPYAILAGTASAVAGPISYSQLPAGLVTNNAAVPVQVANIITASNFFSPLAGSALAVNVNNSYATNYEGANFAFSAPVNVNPANFSSTVIFVTNTTGAGAPIQASCPAAWKTNNGAWTVTNVSAFTLTIIPGWGTNLLWTPLW